MKFLGKVEAVLPPSRSWEPTSVPQSFLGTNLSPWQDKSGVCGVVLGPKWREFLRQEGLGKGIPTPAQQWAG